MDDDSGLRSQRVSNAHVQCALFIASTFAFSVLLFASILFDYTEKTQTGPDEVIRSKGVPVAINMISKPLARARLAKSQLLADRSNAPGRNATIHSSAHLRSNRETISTVEESRKSIREELRELLAHASSDPVEFYGMIQTLDPLRTRDGPGGFSCPSDLDRHLDYPPLNDNSNAKRFKNIEPGTFIFYQHVRKAGGTGFCEMAKANLPRKTVPAYYCMPDNRGSLSTPPWNDSAYFMAQVTNHKYRIVANEWDVFYDVHSQLPGVVLATTFRDPIDRWYSQYRFEHLEHRDGSKWDAKRFPFVKWYTPQLGWKMGSNYYVKTFIGRMDHIPPRNKRDFYWTYHKYNKVKVTYDMFAAAVENLRRFDLVLITEWLEFAGPLIQQVLGWTSPPKKVLPHEVQARRVNETKSKTARANLPPEDFEFMVRDNVYDLLLFEVAKRLFLERIACAGDEDLLPHSG